MDLRRFRFAQVASLALLLAPALWAGAAHGDIEVEVSGVENAVRDNVLVFLSLQRYRNADDLTTDTVERLIGRAEREVRQALKPFGYYFPKVDAQLQTRSDANWQVKVVIQPGPAVVVRQLRTDITGPGADQPVLRRVIGASLLRQGQRLNHGAYDKLKGDLQRTAISNGYLEAAFKQHELRVDLDNLSADVSMELATGPRYRFGETLIEQDAIKPELARRFLRYKESDYFDTRSLLNTQFALEDSQYFASVEVVTGTRDTDSLRVPVTITAQPYRKDTYSIGLGYATDTRWRGTVGWDNRRVNRSGHRAHARITAADTELSLATRYLIPVGDPALEKLSFDAGIRNEELADLDVHKIEFRPGLTQVMGSWQRVLSLSATREKTTAAGQSTTDFLVIPGISYARVPRDFSGDLLSLKPGLYAELLGSHSAFGSGADFLRLHVRGERVFDFGEHWHLLLRGEAGLSAVADFSELPGSQRFFAGGDSSVRGFSLNDLSPTEQAFDSAGDPVLDEDGQPVLIKTGGRHLLVGSIEVVRDLPRNFGVAVFLDGGNAVNRLGDPLEYSIGIGIRWRLPVVTVGIDIAQALSRSDLGPHIHLNISPKL